MNPTPPPLLTPNVNTIASFTIFFRATYTTSGDATVHRGAPAFPSPCPVIRRGKVYPAGLAERVGISLETLRDWLKRSDVQAGPKAGLSVEEREELVALRRKVRRVSERCCRYDLQGRLTGQAPKFGAHQLRDYPGIGW
jgi:hypothetical protein